MSHTNQTANYHLPQFIGTDKPAWLVDVNQAMADIDTQMKANETASATAEADAQSALSGVTALNSQVGGIQTSVTALETQAPLDEAQIETNRQNIATNAQNIVDLDNRMGHTPITGIGDGSATGAIKAVDDKVGDLDDLDTTDKTSVVNAINELVAGGGADPSTVRYDETTGYIQCKDAQGWFNWRKASREVFNAIVDSTVVKISKRSTASSSPEVTLINNVLKIAGGNGKGGCCYIEPKSEAYTVHYTGTAQYTFLGATDVLYMGYCDAVSDGLVTNGTNVVTLQSNQTLAFNDDTFTVPAGKYLFFSVNSASATEASWSFTSLYGV